MVEIPHKVVRISLHFSSHQINHCQMINNKMIRSNICTQSFHKKKKEFWEWDKILILKLAYKQ